MSRNHLVRVGVMGEIGRFQPVDAVRYPRSSRVIVRTRRGLEIGEILVPDADGNSAEPEGTILRRMTTEDNLLESRLLKNRSEAFAACSARLAELASPPVLLDVEHLFDGRSLYFYFLGEVRPEVEAITNELAALYEMHSGLRQFQETLTAGCGPGCGTENAAGGCGAKCVSCSLSKACATSNG